MGSHSTLDEFLRACDDIDEARLSPQLTMHDDEAADVRAGVATLGDPVGTACQVILDNWADLDAVGRVAALIAFANALASAC